jgi:glycogen operon protein
MNLKIQAGRSFPLGATVFENGVNFSVFSKSSTGLELLLFDHHSDPEPIKVIQFNPKTNRTFYYWHIFVEGIGKGQVYAFRANGPNNPEQGSRFDRQKILLDPYGRCVAVPDRYDRKKASLPGKNTSSGMRSVVADPEEYDWEGDAILRTPFSQTVIYEMHVAGFTKNPNSGVDPSVRGTYKGVIEKIPYLRELGITSVELLPVYHFDTQDCPNGLVNYWGYSPVSFFAPHSGYAADKKNPLSVLDEFRDMVKALHRAGLEVILDVVYNHTAEGDHRGPTLCFKGFENSAYYILEKERERYANYSGTGNTLNANHSIVRRMILDSLRYWVQQMHVDGFRFDLASILSRDESGKPMMNPPILWDIESDPVLAGTKLIAEAWDAAGLYQVGTFIGDRWKEWNGKFRDDSRAFFRGDRGTVSRLSSRFLASPDIYGHEDREAEQSINFVTCHDGFTLNDLVTYSSKRNLANLENNRDGSDHNLSWNCGIEGPTDDPEIEQLRLRQIKNFLSITLLSLGTPMILMGDEVRRTQNGNNNAYCQDNELSWFDWDLVEKNRELHRFTQVLIHLNRSFGLPREDHRITLNQLLKRSRIQWHGVQLNNPDWGEDSHSLAVTIQSLSGTEVFHLMLNAYSEPLEFKIPSLEKKKYSAWRRILDTGQESPEEVLDWVNAPVVRKTKYRAIPYSIVLLAALQNGSKREKKAK